MAQVVETAMEKRQPRRWFLRIVLTAVPVIVAGISGHFWFNGNLGVVEPDRVYRSAQPGYDLRERIARDHLASILNLRGGSSDDPWYNNEVEATREQGVAFYDLPLSATRRPLRRELLILLDLFDRCAYPLLIHCKSGSDRTGLASALYLMCQKGESPEQALRAFSLKYGHIPLFGPEHLHEPLVEYAAWLKAENLVHTPARFRTWVERVYESKDQRQKVPSLQPGPRRQGSQDKPLRR